MKNIRYILLLIITMSAGLLSAQVIRNDGKINVSAGYMVISGNYQNETTGGIVIDGTIRISGDWTNNGTTTVIETPDTDGEVVFNGTGTQTIGGSSTNVFNFERLTINTGSTTQVQAGKGVTAYGACTFTAPLVLTTTTTAYRPIMATFINESTVTGNITMELSYTSTGYAAAGAGRGLYLSSPISNATSTIFNVASLADSNLLYYQDEVARKYVKITANETPLTVAKGYILRTPTTMVYNFSGTPNTASSYTNNNIPRAVDGQFYLYGNPYPSVIDWDQLTKTNLSSTIWYNTSTTDGDMVVDTWNNPAGVGTSRNGTATVDGNIPPMQSFWVQCTATGLTGTLTVDWADRSHDWGSSQFLKSAPSEKSDKDFIRLYLNTSETQQDEAIVLQSDSADDNFDEWDSRKMILRDGIRAEVYTVSPEPTNLVIQSVKPITESKEIKIGMIIPVSGNYSFKTNFDNSGFKQNVFLKDKLLDSIQDLFANSEYFFSSDAIQDTSRFSLLFLPAPKLLTVSEMQVCAPKTADLTDVSVTSGSDEGLTFSYWLDANATIAHTTPESSGSGIYYIKAVAINGTYSISQPITVIVNETPTIVVNPITSICEPGTINLTDSLITEGSTAELDFSYWLDEEATNPLSNPETVTTGTYYIKGISETTGCYSISEPIEVIVNPQPEIVINNPDPVDSLSTVDLTAPEITAGSTTGLSYTYWLDDIATIPYLTPQYAVAGNYYLLGTNVITGCFNIAGPVTVSYSSPTGIIDEIIKEIAIYSVNNSIYVNNAEPGTKILVYNIVGNLLYNKLSTSDREIISTNYKPGIYVVKVVAKQNVKSQKVYIQ